LRGSQPECSYGRVPQRGQHQHRSSGRRPARRAGTASGRAGWAGGLGGPAWHRSAAQPSRALNACCECCVTHVKNLRVWRCSVRFCPSLPYPAPTLCRARPTCSCHTACSRAPTVWVSGQRPALSKPQRGPWAPDGRGRARRAGRQHAHPDGLVGAAGQHAHARRRRGPVRLAGVDALVGAPGPRYRVGSLNPNICRAPSLRLRLGAPLVGLWLTVTAQAVTAAPRSTRVAPPLWSRGARPALPALPTRPACCGSPEVLLRPHQHAASRPTPPASHGVGVPSHDGTSTRMHPPPGLSPALPALASLRLLRPRAACARAGPHAGGGRSRRVSPLFGYGEAS
jgi:hypothetical protein